MSRRGAAWFALLSAVAACAGLSPAASAAPPAGRPFGPPPSLPSGARRIGALSSSRQLHLTIVLRSADPEGLAQYAAGTTRRGSGHFHRYLSVHGFAERFGASAGAISSVRAFLESQGLSPGATSANGLAIPIVASAGDLERALRVSLSRYRLASGREAYANTSSPLLPAELAPYVQAVLGLNDLHPLRPLLALPAAGSRSSRLAQTSESAPQTSAGAAQVRESTPQTSESAPQTSESAPQTSGPSACKSAEETAASYEAWTAPQLAQAYELNRLYGLGLLGGGVTVGLYELEPYEASEIAEYQHCYGTSTSVENVEVAGGLKSGPSGGEAALDIEDVAGLAPDVKILVYEAPNNNSDAYDNYSAMVSEDRAKVISTSWGLCEQETERSYIEAESTLFEEAAVQGQTVLAAAGDEGSTDCGTKGPHGHELAVDDPASQPYVTGVGGTSLSALGPPPREVVWNDSCSGGPCAGGGGISTVWPMPSWQSAPGVDNSYSSGEPCKATSGYCREVPDVSASADPYHGYVVYYKGKWSVIGGTSGAAPLWAALVAIVDNGCAAGPVGFINPRLYQAARLGPSPFNDITKGDNAIASFAEGRYPATSGYDMASGLGSPIAPTLLDALCAPAVQQISPAGGPAAGGTKVTITGSGFARGAAVYFGQARAGSVEVESATTLSAVAPGGAGTVAVSVHTAGGASATEGEDTFSYGTPSLSGESSEGAAPGSTVTIKGSGFGATQGEGYVSFVDSGISWGAPGDAARLAIDSWGPESISFTVPSVAKPWGVSLESTAQVSVTAGGVSSNALALKIVPSEAITIEPPSPDPALSGQTVTIKAAAGSSFGSTPGWVSLVDSGISFGSPSDAAQLANLTWGTESISFTLPSLALPWALIPDATASVSVTSASGGLSNVEPITIGPTSPLLSLAIASPSSDAATPGEQVTLTGEGLGSPGWVTFIDSGISFGAPSDAAQLAVGSWSSSGETTTITFTVPEAQSGPWMVTPGSTATVMVTNSTGAFSNAVPLKISSTGSLAISLASPSSGKVTEGQKVTITGKELGSPGWVSLIDAGVSWGAPSDAARLPIDSWSTNAEGVTSITFTMPSPQGPANEWQLIPSTTATIAVTSEAWKVSNTLSLTVEPTGSIPLLSISPADPEPGQAVTLTGSGFGATQGSGYVTLIDNGVSFGAPNDAAALTIGEWQTDSTGTSTIVFDMPSSSGTWHLTPGTTATLFVTSAAGAVSNEISFTVP